MAYTPEYAGKYLACTVLRLERSSIFDGDGFRTVVFFKGCPLRCQWCSTPESQSFNIEEAKEEKKTYGQIMTVEEILCEVRKDAQFYFHSSGGMTLSGGEALSQPETAEALLRQARAEGINTAIETSCFAPVTAVDQVLPHANTAYIDLKLLDSKKHKRFCGRENGAILYNILHTNEMDWNGRLIIRVPVIPGVNDAPGELEAVGRFCAQLKKLETVQLLPYHGLGVDTYRKLGRPYQLPELIAPAPAHMERCAAYIRKWVPVTL